MLVALSVLGSVYLAICAVSLALLLLLLRNEMPAQPPVFGEEGSLSTPPRTNSGSPSGEPDRISGGAQGYIPLAKPALHYRSLAKSRRRLAQLPPNRSRPRPISPARPGK